MRSTEFQLFSSVIKNLLLPMPTLFFMGFLTFNFEEHLNMVLIFIGIQILILLSVQARFILKRKVLGNSLLSDKPRPSLVDIVKMGILPFLQTVLFILGSSFIVIITWKWGYASITGWLFGMMLFGLWIYGCRVVYALSTLYLVTDKGLWIYFGLDEIFIPYSKILEVYFSKTVQTDISKLMKGSRSYIPGVRNNDFLVLQLRIANDLIRLWFPEIYITPTNPAYLLNILREHM